MHRFDEAGRIPFIKRMHDQGLIASISVGVKDYEYDFVSQLKADAPEYITIDIAHGHADSVISMIQHIKKELPDTFVIAGNVGTPEAVRELENAGADATKVGIGPGKVCITNGQDRFWYRWLAIGCPFVGVPRLHVNRLLLMEEFVLTVILPSLSASVLAWSWLVPSLQDTSKVQGKRLKSMVNSSKNTMVQPSQYQKGAYKNVEGKRILLPAKGHLQDTLTEMEQDLQSAISYAGGRPGCWP